MVHLIGDFSCEVPGLAPGQWVVQELEFFTSEFCVQDPQLTDARIYGIPLAMQGGDAGELGPRALGEKR